MYYVYQRQENGQKFLSKHPSYEKARQWVRKRIRRLNLDPVYTLFTSNPPIGVSGFIIRKK